MVLITFHDKDQWPVKLETAEEVNPDLARNAYSVLLTGEDLTLVHDEILGLPIPKYILDWQDGFTFYWTDAATIIGNIRAAFLINKEATRK